MEKKIQSKFSFIRNLAFEILIINSRHFPNLEEILFQFTNDTDYFLAGKSIIEIGKLTNESAKKFLFQLEIDEKHSWKNFLE